MLTHPTLDQLRQMKLDGMAEAFVDLQAQDATTDLSHAEWLGLLVDREVVTRNTRRFQTRMRAAKLRHIGAAIEDVDFRTPRKLDRALDHCPRTNGGQGLSPATRHRTLD